MTQPADAPKPEPVAFHVSPVDALGFLTIPNLVVLRHDISLSAKIVYGYLNHLAWRGRTNEVGTGREIIATDLGVGLKAVTGYIKELTDAPVAEGDTRPDAPRLVVSVRRGLGRSNVYGINSPEKGSTGKVGSTLLEGSDRPNPARARSLSGPKTTNEEKEPPLPPIEEPPPNVLAGKRNIPLDVLMEVCSITAADTNKRAVLAAVALNGRTNKRTGKVTTPGIRHAFWEECIRQAHAQVAEASWPTPDAHGDVSEIRPPRTAEERLRALQADPDRFAQLLADRIRTKAAAYKTAMPGMTCSPEALLKWWHDVGAIDRPGLTPDEIARLGDA